MIKYYFFLNSTAITLILLIVLFYKPMETS